MGVPYRLRGVGREAGGGRRGLACSRVRSLPRPPPLLPPSTRLPTPARTSCTAPPRTGPGWPRHGHQQRRPRPRRPRARPRGRCGCWIRPPASWRQTCSPRPGGLLVGAWAGGRRGGRGMASRPPERPHPPAHTRTSTTPSLHLIPMTVLAASGVGWGRPWARVSRTTRCARSARSHRPPAPRTSRRPPPFGRIRSGRLGRLGRRCRPTGRTEGWRECARVGDRRARPGGAWHGGPDPARHARPDICWPTPHPAANARHGGGGRAGPRHGAAAVWAAHAGAGAASARRRALPLPPSQAAQRAHFGNTVPLEAPARWRGLGRLPLRKSGGCSGVGVPRGGV